MADVVPLCSTVMPDPSSLYIDRPGDFLPRHPYLHERVQLRSFLLEADPQKLQALCDRSLNVAAGGKINFRPLSSTVWLTFARIPRITSTDPRDRDTGWMSEADVAFWVPLVSTCDGVARTCWYMPFVFVDSPFGMVGGREIYGFVKTLARFEIPEALDSGAPYAVEAMSLAQRGADSRVQMHRLLELTQKPQVPGRAPAAPLRSVRNMIEMMPLLQGQGWRERLGVARSQIASFLVRREVPIVFLRQLRDLEHPERAAFRELAEAPAKVTRFYRGGFLPDEFELKLEASASHPMAETLGLRGAGHPVKAAFWAEFDFLMDKGVRLAGPRGARGSSRGVAPIASPACLPALPEASSRATAVSDAPRKIAVLGGGIGSLSMVLALTNEPNWRDRYDITVYQMGGRLGGKGASSRNLDVADRIEEHGLHIWFGFYDQAFRMMRQCYEERNLPKGTPLATFEDAFKPQRSVVLTEQVGREWQPWVLDFPANNRVPGDGRAAESVAEWTRDMFSWTRTGIESFWGLLFPAHAADNRGKPRLRSRLRTARSSLLALFRIADRALRHAAVASPPVPTVDTWRAANALRQVRDLLRATAGSKIESDTRVRRVWLCVDFSLSNLIGMLVDRVPQRGFEHLDEIDYAAWLSRHGAMPMTVTSPLVRAIYDLAFAYRDGDVSKPDFGAGTALQGVLRMLLTYRGAFMWKMQAGMGEVVITPLYEVLRARGVKFEFFHRVRSLGLSRDGEQLETIHVGRQATVKDGAYRPLVDVGGVACWPHRPLYDQLVEGEALAAAGVDLESTWGPWPDVETRVLRLGTDFDEVVLGISLGALPAISSELIERKPKFRAMVENVKTTPTLAFQVWAKPTLGELGSTHVSRCGERTVQGAFVEPIDTWADMSHLLGLERWPAAHRPGNLAYYCGPLDQRAPASAVTRALAASELQRVKAMARAFLDRDALVMFPRAAAPGGGFNWELLIDVAGRRGPERLDGQYYRANIDGSERYVLSVAGSNRYRLKTDGSGVKNLFLTGDWVDCGLNAGCIEATVMAGNQCARAVADKTKATRLLASVA